MAPQGSGSTMPGMTGAARLDEAPPTASGPLYAVLSGALAGALLSPAVLVTGVTMEVVAEVARGDNIAWQSSVAMNYVFIGVPALLVLVMLAIPARMLRSARVRLGHARAIRWAGAALTTWLAGIAMLWFLEALGSRRPALETGAAWYAAAFALASAVAGVGTLVVERRAMRAAIALAGGVAVGLVALGATLVVVWGSPPRIPVGAQVVHVSVADSIVRLDPPTVHAGEVHFVVEGSDEAAASDTFAFVSSGYGDDDAPLPLGTDAASRLLRGDYQGTATEGGWPAYAELTLLEGPYAFVVFGPAGEVPDSAPISVTILEVRP